MVKLASKGRKLTRAVPENSTQDLRSRSVERKRDRDQKTKWSPRWAHPGNPPATYEGPNGVPKPVIRINRKCMPNYRSAQSTSVEHRQHHQESKRPVLNVDTWHDESAEDDYSHSDEDDSMTAADVDVKYSYDAHTGPAVGEEVLEIAVTKALERFEDDQTNKLINDEYEVLESTTEEDFDGGRTVTVEDEGFELV